LQRLDGLTKTLPVATIQASDASADTIRTLTRERDDALAEVARLTAVVARLGQSVSDAGWAADAAREQYERDHALDWR
jgi:hypothetical protein